MRFGSEDVDRDAENLADLLHLLKPFLVVGAAPADINGDPVFDELLPKFLESLEKSPKK